MSSGLIITILFSFVLALTTVAGLGLKIRERVMFVKDLILTLVFTLYAPAYMPGEKAFAMLALVGIATYFVTLNAFKK